MSNYAIYKPKGKESKFLDFVDIPNYENKYKINNKGIIVSFCKKSPTILKQYLKKGYYQVALYTKCKSKYYAVHKLVAICFCGHKPLGRSTPINHIDGNKTNNYYKNLEECTIRENNIDKFLRSKKTSKYTGVCWKYSNNKWSSEIQINKINVYLGLYDDELIAHKIYLTASNNFNLFNGNISEFRNKIKNIYNENINSNRP